MKIARYLNAVCYIIAVVFGILDLTLGNERFKIVWITFLGIASFLLLILSILQLKQKKIKNNNKKIN